MNGEKNTTVLVTGGAGFIGSNYINRFVPRIPKRRFINVDSLTYAADVRNITVEGAPNYAFEQVDIRDIAALRRVFEEYKPNAIIHFAAESHVDMSIKNPDVFVDTNVKGTHHLLMLAREYGVQRFHHISTDEVYGALPNAKSAAFTESSPLAPRNPSSASKAASDLFVSAYCETFGLNTVITRSGNNYGPHQDLSKVIPSFIAKLLKGERVPLYGKGAQMREWIYVEDCVDAIHVVFEKGISGEVYNISGGHEYMNLELTRKLLQLTGRDESYIAYVTERLGHDFRYALDSSKTRSLGWKPNVSFDDGLRRTLAYVQRRFAL